MEHFPSKATIQPGRLACRILLGVKIYSPSSCFRLVTKSILSSRSVLQISFHLPRGRKASPVHFDDHILFADLKLGGVVPEPCSQQFCRPFC